MSRRKNRAFSLIEISVVIVIVMIMIAGLLQGSRVISSMRITTARNVTNSSAMPWINYIVTWYDVTASDAFVESENDDGDKISRWNGAELRYTDRVNLTQTDETKKPILISNGMYGNVVEDIGDLWREIRGFTKWTMIQKEHGINSNENYTYK